MKFISTITATVTVIGFLTACSHGRNTAIPSYSVSTNEVILQSIEKIETMATSTGSQIGETTQSLRSIQEPNVHIEYQEAEESLFEGAKFALEFSKCLGTKVGMKDDVVYYDPVRVPEFGHVDVYGKKYVMNDLVCVSIKVEDTSGLNQEFFHAYFEYDYDLNEPTITTVIDIKTGDVDGYYVIVAQFDYTQNDVFGYRLGVNNKDNKHTVEPLLNARIFDFEKFQGSQVEEYEFVKLNTESKDLEGYGYSTHEAPVTGGERMDSLKELYTIIYDRIKQHFKNDNPWDTGTVVEKSFFLEVLTSVLALSPAQ